MDVPILYTKLRTGHYHNKPAFVVTTYCARRDHLKCLYLCIRSIRKHYPRVFTYVLDDGSLYDITQLLPPVQKGVREGTLKVCPAPSPKSGELNPYLFIGSEECRHRRLIYIHDSVVVRPGLGRALRMTKGDDIVVLWVAKECVWDDVWNKHNDTILDQLRVRGRTAREILHQQYQEEKGRPKDFHVTFGAMSVFTRSFMERVNRISNFQQVAHLFTTRTHRCLFERLLTLFMVETGVFHSTKNICGDIFDHPDAFSNTDPHAHAANSVAVKMWQGR